jgi:hypothetical protein
VRTYPKGASGEELRKHSAGCNYCDGVTDRGTRPMPPLPESVAGFLILVELCKGLVVVPGLVSSVEMNGKS